jgi:hypothetical protein
MKKDETSSNEEEGRGEGRKGGDGREAQLRLC